MKNDPSKATAARRHDETGRTTPKRILSSKARKQKKIEGPFAPRLIEMLESPAWNVLSLSARRVLDRIEIEFAHHGGQDNGALPVTFCQFAMYGIDRHAIAPAIRELVALGFIDYIQGRAGNSEFRMPNKFRLTYRHTEYDGPTQEWRKIETVEQAAEMARNARAASSKPNR